MFAIVYEWQVPSGREQDFIDGWTRSTVSILEHCAGFGSRLHQAEDGRWVAYTRWPSLAEHDRCTPGLVPPLELMNEDIAGAPSVVYRLQIVVDLLDEPHPR